MTTAKFFLIFIFICRAGLLRADEPAKLAPPLDETTMIVDFRANLPGIFQYGTW